MLSTATRELYCKAGPFGSTRVRNVLKDFCFEGNISDVDDEVTKVFARNYC
jgi:hypothetical protein